MATVDIAAGEYMVIDEVEDNGMTIVTVVRTAAAADAVAAYYDCRDEVAATNQACGWQ